jgi:hypothetical protein
MRVLAHRLEKTNKAAAMAKQAEIAAEQDK